MLNVAELYYFSPTGGTKKVAESFCREISRDVRMTDLGSRNAVIGKASEAPVVVAAPVFGGRIPQVAAQKLNLLEGGGRKAVVLAVYGNRAYEDALLELKDIMTEKGFQVIAAGAFVAQHSIVPEVGKGRPDEKDLAQLREFAARVLEKIEAGSETEAKVPGNHPYKNGMSVPATPISLTSCQRCKKCESVCPTGAVHIENDLPVTDQGKCILCMACVAACTYSARVLPPPLQQKMEQMLGALKSVRGENEYFV